MTGTRAVVVVAILLGTSELAHARTGWPEIHDVKEVGGGSGDAAIIASAETYLKVAPVPGALANGIAWHTYLVNARRVPAERVVFLRNDEVTAETFLEKLSHVSKLVRAGGTLWVIFIGHGAPAKDGKDGLLIAIDAQQSVDSIIRRSVRRSEVLKIAAGSRAARSVVVLDACFSGRSDRGKPLVEGLQPLVAEEIPAVPPRDNVVLFTAAKGNEFAGPLPGVKRPAFSYLVLGALRGWADTNGNGEVTADEVLNFTKNTLTMSLNDRTQTPTLEGDAKSSLGRAWEKPLPSSEIAAWTRGAADTATDRGRAPRQLSCPNGTAFIEGGAFHPMHSSQVEAVEPFCLDKTEVTLGTYMECVERGSCPRRERTVDWPGIRSGEKEKWSVHCNKAARGEPGAPRTRSTRGKDDHPVNCVTWVEAASHCKSVGKRLPTENEWEWAARGGQEARKYPWGQEEPALQLCWSGASRLGGTCPVGAYREGASRDGVLDLAGSVWEWTASRVALGKAIRIIRGGSWSEVTAAATSDRRAAPQETSDFAIGFRCARSR